MKFLVLTLALFATSALAFDFPFFGSDDYSPLVPVNSLNITLYAGSWYEIGRFPYIWEASCYCTVATYTINSDGTVGVRNVCNWGSASGKVVAAEGKATADDGIKNGNTTGRLTVEFFGFVKAPYYVIDLDPNYQWALVGSPNRDYLWILARTPTIDDGLYNELVSVAASDEFNTTKFIKGVQGDVCNYNRTASITI